MRPNPFNVPTLDRLPEAEEPSVVRVFGRIAPGRVIAGKYLVERELAAGGVGVVVLATHIELGHRVAIKFLHAHRVHDPMIVERFKREARLAASIRSEHVVRIHDVGTLEDGAPYMVMEYLEGEDLGAVLARTTEPIDVDIAVDWVLQACQALSEAHAMGIVHRDLKPENLFLARRTGSGAYMSSSLVKIVDFGISKVSEDSARGLPRMTGDHERFGTPVYMSPEQLRSSASVDGRSDIWSLGVVLYELLTKDLPFDGQDLPALISNVFSSSPTPIRQKRPDVSATIESIILSCLARDREYRPSSVDELMQMLAPFASPLTSDTARPPRVQHHVISTPNAAWAVPSSSSPSSPSSPSSFGAAGQNTSYTLTEAMDNLPLQKTATKRTALGIALVSAIGIASAGFAALLVTAATAHSSSSSAHAETGRAVGAAIIEPAHVTPPSTLDASVTSTTTTTTTIIIDPTPPPPPPPPPATMASAAATTAPPSPPSIKKPNVNVKKPAAPSAGDYDEFGGRK